VFSKEQKPSQQEGKSKGGLEKGVQPGNTEKPKKPALSEKNVHAKQKWKMGQGEKSSPPGSGAGFRGVLVMWFVLQSVSCAWASEGGQVQKGDRGLAKNSRKKNFHRSSASQASPAALISWFNDTVRNIAPEGRSPRL